MRLNTKLWLLITISSVIGLVLFISLTLLSGYLFSEGYGSEELNELGQQITEEAEALHAEPDQIMNLMREAVQEHPQLELEWVGPNGSLQYATGDRTADYTFHEMTSLFLQLPDSIWTPGMDFTLVFSWGTEQSPQYLVMHVPDEAMQASQLKIYLRDNSELLLLLMPLALFIATPYIFSLFFLSRINRRLHKLTAAMNDVHAEKSFVTIEDHSKDEIGQLSRHFNAMSRRISEQIAQIQEYENNKKTLIANISHDLRTPMTTIQGYAETLMDELEQPDADTRTYAEIIWRRSHYMDTLLHKLLEISNLDSQKGNIQLQPSNVAAHVRKIAADFVPILEANAITFHVQIPDHPVMAHTDPYLFERAIRNLIENAIQYGSSGQYVGITVEDHEHTVQIRITDRGPGIHAEQIPLIFDRFYRGSDARVGDGMGIGLSIVREIADGHQGTIEVYSVANENTEFTLTLQKARYTN